jgi:acyl dehydratase
MHNGSYSTLLDAWSETSTRMLTSAIEANRAAMTAFRIDLGDSDDGEKRRVEERLEPAGDLPEWEVEIDADADLTVGDTVRFTKTLEEADVDRFAAASGDTNPIHLDDEWADATRFEGRIVHGILASGLISAALARLPGGVVYLSQDLEFRAPVRIGDRITGAVEVVEDLGSDRYRLRTTVSDGENVVIDGEAVVLVDEIPA